MGEEGQVCEGVGEEACMLGGRRGEEGQKQAAMCLLAFLFFIPSEKHLTYNPMTMTDILPQSSKRYSLSPVILRQ